MAYEIPGFSWTLPSAADYTAGGAKFRFVSINGTAKAVLTAAATTAAGAAVVGVCQTSPRLNEEMTIVTNGITFMVTGGAVTPGSLVTSDATGRAVVATVGQAALGLALETSSGAGIQIAVLLKPSVTVAP